MGLVPDYGNDITLKQVTQLFWLPRAYKSYVYSMKVKVIDSLWPHGLYSPWNSLGQNTGVGSLPNPGLLHCRLILYQLSHKGKPRNTGVCNLSLLQWIFPTQELNRGLLHCRWILYQLSYQGSPVYSILWSIKCAIALCLRNNAHLN